jgi:hypothetical protein
VDDVVGRERRGGWQLPEHPHVPAREPDLLLGLSQRRIGKVSILGIATAAGKGDLTRMALQICTASRENDVRLLRVAGEKQRNEDGGRDLLGRGGSIGDA